MVTIQPVQLGHALLQSWADVCRYQQAAGRLQQQQLLFALPLAGPLHVYGASSQAGYPQMRSAGCHDRSMPL